MKGTFFTVFLLFLFINLNAQFSISTDSVYVDVVTGNEYGTVDITNDSIGGEILWVLTTECEPENWVHYVMDMNINYIPGIDSLSFPLGANESGILRMFLLLPELPGMARYSMEIWEQGDRENAKFVNFFFNDYECPPTAVDDFSKKVNLEVYPNPFNDHFIIKTEAEIALMEMFDLQGRKVLQQGVNTGSNTEVNAGELEKSVYCLIFKNKAGKIVAREIVMKM